MKQYFVCVKESGKWKKMPYPAPTLKDADIIAKHAMATKPKISEVKVISEDYETKKSQTHRSYSKESVKKSVKKSISPKSKDNFTIQIQEEIAGKWQVIGKFDDADTALLMANGFQTSNKLRVIKL